MIIKLSPFEFADAWDAGKARHVHHCDRKRQRVTEYGCRLESMGAVAELAVARAFGGRWRPEVGREHYGSTDVTTGCGERLEVKATDWPNGKLFVYSDTADDLPVILCIVDRPALTVRLAGWIMSSDAKRDENWNPDLKVPCFQIVQADLRSLQELPCLSSLNSPLLST